MVRWTYPAELLEALGRFRPGAASGDAAAARPRSALGPLSLGNQAPAGRLLAGEFPKADYIGHVIALRKKYWPLELHSGAVGNRPGEHGGRRGGMGDTEATEHETRARAAAKSRQTLPRILTAASRPCAARRRTARNSSLFPELAFTPFYPQHAAVRRRWRLAEPVPGPDDRGLPGAGARARRGDRAQPVRAG